MARVTVEDCLSNVRNRFELVLLATKRARQLLYGKDAHVDWENDKATVVALREIAEGKISEEILAAEALREKEVADREALEQAAAMVEVAPEPVPPAAPAEE